MNWVYAVVAIFILLFVVPFWSAARDKRAEDEVRN